MSAEPFTCPCGAPAPAPLPSPGCEPVPCARCRTPLVAPGNTPRDATLRAAAAGLGAAGLGAVAWTIVAVRLATGAPWTIAVGGVAIGVACRTAAGARGPSVQGAGLASFLAFLAGGEALLFHRALAPRLLAMHRAEGTPSAEILADRELDAIGWGGYLRLEIGLAWCAAIAAGLAVVWVLCRAPRAVAAFPVRHAGGEPAAEADAAAAHALSDAPPAPPDA